MRISGSLWSVPTDEQCSRLRQVIDNGLTYVHWDTTDGTYAAPGGFSPTSAKQLLGNCPPVQSEAHLMMHDPLAAVDEWAGICALIAVPAEIEHLSRVVDRIHSHGIQAALAVSLRTRLPEVPSDLPLLVMGITPGQSGHARHDPRASRRVAWLRDRGRNPLIGVDGDVRPESFSALAAAGANWIVSGSSLFSHPVPKDWLGTCRAAFAPP